ncbi:sarcosine oxidase subunit gamma [Bradyrhizobium sp. ERR14]|uniref:sarcosine oxidase subunit gamma n=1 Tax=Bradyrhizobium sp. ERR14 TaxID=2663837 RepID=UPI00160860B3|nr:sarcosine oxidase subunit gamma family protein [Bradyrhizobium sp. ERR14]MBB4398500.1 sarcosine oxidase subunit gamma [Bradyrhizobium sp. ERR14]
MVEQATPLWRPRGAWAGIVEAGQIGASGKSGVIATTLDGMGFATVIAPAGSADLESATKRMISLDLPQKGATTRSHTHALAWAGAAQWLLIARQRAGLTDLLRAISNHAAVSDQTHGRAAIRISGARVHQVLAKGSMVDLHPSVFPVGATALTIFAHINVQLWRADDGPDGPVFEILVPRSMATSFWSWFTASAAEFGCQVLGRD